MLDLNKANGVKMAGTDDAEDQELSWRALATRSNYLALDRPDMQYAVKEICHGVTATTRRHQQVLYRLGRYLAPQGRTIWWFAFQGQEETQAYSDSDWAGCRKTCRSKSGGALMHGRHCANARSSNQKSVALISYGEAELLAAVKASCEATGLIQMATYLGCNLSVTVMFDSTATLGVVNRRGNGKLRHVRSVAYGSKKRRRQGRSITRK